MRLILLCVLLLAGCGQSVSGKAQEDVDFLTNHNGSARDLCDAYTRLADAYRAEHNAKGWEGAKFFQRNTCVTAAAEAHLRSEE